MKTKVKDLIPDDKNFNKGNEYGESLIAKSFQKFGAGRSILLDKNNKVIAGNKSLQKFAEQGLEDVQIIESDGKKLIAVKRTDIDLDTPEGREMALADNATAKANIEWDFPALELAVTEFDIKPLDWGVKMPHEVSEDDYVVPDEIETDILAGDLFEIGQHMLLCGDYRIPDDVKKVICGQKAACVSDPPYGINVDTTWLSVLHVKNGKPANKSDDTLQNDDGTLDLSELYLFKEWVLFGFPYIGRTEKYTGLLIWDKRGDGGEKGIGNPVEVAIGNCFNGYRLSRYAWAGYIKPKGEKREKHPTQKPVGILADAINLTKNKIVYDPFLGSGTTMVAAHQLNRKCIGIEISPQYCQIIVERMLKLDPSLQIKRNGKPFHVEQSNKQDNKTGKKQAKHEKSTA